MISGISQYVVYASQTQKRSICAWWRSDLELGLPGLRSFCNLIRVAHIGGEIPHVLTCMYGGDI